MEKPMRQSLCSICGQQSAIYTCPRCSTHTCSLPCSRSHKEIQSCSGERDRSKYVPMNKYGWGTMVNDYVYLEELSRKAAEWGNDIVKGGYLSAATAARGRARGRGRGTTSNTRGRGKRDLLKMQLNSREIDMDLLPVGMEKRRVNRSTWDVRCKSLFLTLEFAFHSARSTMSNTSHLNPFRILTHRNDLNRTLLDLLRHHLKERVKKANLPSWIQSLASSTEDGDDILFLISQQNISLSYSVPRAYHKLDPTQTLALCLRNKSFVEFPTIDVWKGGIFTGPLIEPDGTFVDGEVSASPAKRTRLDIVNGRKMIESLVCEYGSDEDRLEGNVLSMLDTYGSEEEPGSEGESAVEEEAVIEDHEVAEEDHVEEGYDNEHFTAEDLQDILAAVGKDGMAFDDMCWAGKGDDEVDWDFSDEDETGALERALSR